MLCYILYYIILYYIILYYITTLKQSKQYCSLPDPVNSFTLAYPTLPKWEMFKKLARGRFFFRHFIFIPTLPLAPLSQPRNQQRWPAGHMLQHLPSDHTGYFSLPTRITLKPPSLMPKTPFLWRSSATILRAFLDSNKSDIDELNLFSHFTVITISAEEYWLWSIYRAGNTVTSFKIQFLL